LFAFHKIISFINLPHKPNLINKNLKRLLLAFRKARLRQKFFTPLNLRSKFIWGNFAAKIGGSPAQRAKAGGECILKILRIEFHHRAKCGLAVAGSK